MANNLIDRVDIKSELEAYSWRQASWHSDKLISCSPFRDDHSPSFYVWLEGPNKGLFKDSGGYGEYEKGGFIKLLSFLRKEPYDLTVAYLEESYGDGTYIEGDTIKIPTLSVTPPQNRRFIPELYLDNFALNYDYLLSRGISEQTQKRFGIRYDERHDSIIMPWRYADRTIGNIKYRNLADKRFYYEKGATPIKDLLFGLSECHAVGAKRIAIAEAEIDAMSLWEVGVAAVALGTASMSEAQAVLLEKSTAIEFVIATDMDAAGDKVAEAIYKRLGRYHPVSRYNFSPYKDANEALVNRRS